MFAPLRNQRGQTLALMGIGMIAFAALAVVAVDVGHMALTATEVQTVAEAAATAAAQRFQTSDGVTLWSNNTVAGNVPPINCPSPPCIELGLWHSAATPPYFEYKDYQPYNAARATVTVSDVPNILAGIFGQTSSTITKQAVAAVRPGLPLAIGQGAGCGFTQPCGSGERLTIGLGDLNMSPNATWSTFDPNEVPTETTVFAKMPAQCMDVFGSPGGDQPMPVVEPDSIFNTRSGYLGRPEQALADCVNNGKRTTFLVPIFPCATNPGTGGAAHMDLETIIIDRIDNLTDTDLVSMTIELSCTAAPDQVALVQ